MVIGGVDWALRAPSLRSRRISGTRSLTWRWRSLTSSPRNSRWPRVSSAPEPLLGRVGAVTSKASKDIRVAGHGHYACHIGESRLRSSVQGSFRHPSIAVLAVAVAMGRFAATIPPGPCVQVRALFGL